MMIIMTPTGIKRTKEHFSWLKAMERQLRKLNKNIPIYERKGLGKMAMDSKAIKLKLTKDIKDLKDMKRVG